MDVRYGKVVTKPEEIDGGLMVVVFRQEDWFVTQEVYMSWGGEKWSPLNPEEYNDYGPRYTREDIFNFAEHSNSQVALIDPSEDSPIVTTKEDFDNLPRFSIVYDAQHRIYLVQVMQDAWWDLNDFVGDSNFFEYRNKDLVGTNYQLLWAPEADDE